MAAAAAAAVQLVSELKCDACVCVTIGYAYSIACVCVSAHSNDAIAVQDSNVCTIGTSKISIIRLPVFCIKCGLSVDDLPNCGMDLSSDICRVT